MMVSTRWATLITTALTSVLTLGLAEQANAATPTYWDNRMEFVATLQTSFNDGYDNPAYVFSQNDAVMSAVNGETDYHATGHMNVNLVTNIGFDPRYCAGCNGSFELAFQTTSVGTADGVDAVGIDIESHDNMGMFPYYAYITFADGTTADIALPAGGTFWGVSAPEQIERIHFGLSGGVSTQQGYFEMDDLTIGSTGPQLCGNGELDEDEDCDEMVETVDCDDNCTFVSCGDDDWNATVGEECDDGGDSTNCDADCTMVACGDLYVNTIVEVCDDGMGETATCDLDCTAVACGDGTLNLTAGETCDDAGDSADCDADCTPAECGDGTLNEIALEDCDDEGESATCDADCTVVECPDGVINVSAGEACDSGDGSAECDIDCTAVECGDGLANEAAGEDCDGDGKGMGGETPTCDSDCTAAICGDGVINEALEEACDDGNMSDEDGCSSLCNLEAGTTGGETSGSSSGGSSEESGGEESTTGGDEDSATTTPVPVDPDSGSGGDSSATDDGGAAGGSDGGCGCSSRDRDGGHLVALFVLALFGARRRRGARWRLRACPRRVGQ